MGYAQSRMQASEGPEEVAVPGRGKGDAGVAQQQGEDAGKGRDHDQHRRQPAQPKAALSAQHRGIGRLHDSREQGGLTAVGCHTEHRGSTGQRQHASVEQQVEPCHDRNREQQSAWDRAPRIADLAAEKGDVVVAPEVIGGHQHGRAQAGEEGP